MHKDHIYIFGLGFFRMYSLTIAVRKLLLNIILTNRFVSILSSQNAVNDVYILNNTYSEQYIYDLM